jgi:hypothetical protein
MDAHVPVIIFSIASLIAVSIVSWTMLTAWRDWLAFRKMAIKGGQEGADLSSPTARIELASLKERIRKLEAIASGVDLLP